MGATRVSCMIMFILAGAAFLPKLNPAKAFEDRVREVLGVDVFLVQTEVVERWLYEISGAGGGTRSASLAVSRISSHRATARAADRSAISSPI